MKYEIAPTVAGDYDDLFDVHCEAEAFRAESRDELVEALKRGRCFTVRAGGGEIIGAVVFNNYSPGHDVLIHGFVRPDHHGEWWGAGIRRILAQYAFDMLLLPRVSIEIPVTGKHDRAKFFVEKAGFAYEGCRRKGIKIRDTYFDVLLYGLLAEERSEGK